LILVTSRNLAPSLQHVVGILKTQKITIRQPKELTQTQIRIRGNDVNAVARHANRLIQLVLANTISLRIRNADCEVSKTNRSSGGRVSPLAAMFVRVAGFYYVIFSAGRANCINLGCAWLSRMALVPGGVVKTGTACTIST
jgi:hypothetical protein